MDDHYRIHCAETWGGVQAIDREIVSGPLRASVFSFPSDGEEGGDIYYFSVCGNDHLTRIAIADVQGHGEEVSHVSEWLYELIRDSMDSLDARHVLQRLNQRVIEHGFEAMSTIALLSYYIGDSRLFYSYAGHPPVFLERRGIHTWTPLKLEYKPTPSNLPLGIFAQTEYDQGVTTIAAGDRFFAYTDGVSDALDVRNHLDTHRDKNVVEIKRTVKDGLNAPCADDVTFLVVEAH